MDILPEYQRHEVAASRPGARGEGVCVLVHPDIAHGVGLWRSMPSAAGLWLVLKPAVTGAASDVYLGGVYIPPAQSGLLRTSSASDRFAALTEAASAASALGRVMIMGDFNARVAARSDIDDDQASSLLALDLPVVRACTDRSFGGHGRHLLQLCLSALSLGLAGWLGTPMQPSPTHMQLVGLAPITYYWMLTCFPKRFSPRLMSAVVNLIIFPSSPSFTVSPLLDPVQLTQPMVAALCPCSAGPLAAVRAMWSV